MPHFNTTPAGMVLELVNAANPVDKVFTEENLIFGKPSVLLNNPAGNTQVSARGVQNVDYVGQTTIFYNRLDLGVLFQGNFRPSFEAFGKSSLYRLLPDLNQALGTNFTERDLTNIDLTLLGEGDQVVLELRAKPESVAYVGFTRILFNRKIVTLTDFVTTRDLGALALHHPDPELEGYQSAGLLTWGLDFTLLERELLVHRSGYGWRGIWAYHTALQEKLAKEYGIESWPQNNYGTDAVGRITDYPTTAVPEANKEFQRVVVQTDIRSNGYIGTAYFHYNEQKIG